MMLGRVRDDDLLRQIAADVATIKADMATVKDASQDHETRLRALERWRYALPVSAVSGLVAVTIEVAAHIH